MASAFVLHPYRLAADTRFDRASLKFAHLPDAMLEAGDVMMLKWGLVFFLLAVASSLAGVVAEQNVAMSVLAQVLFFTNIVLFVVFTILGAIDGRRDRGRLRTYQRIR